MKSLITCVLVLAVTTDIVKGVCRPDYAYLRRAGGWLKVYSEPATFQEATDRCRNESGYLAFPHSEGLLKSMISLMNANQKYYIGSSMSFSPRFFLSSDGANFWKLNNMPIMNKNQSLDNRLCLSMNQDRLKVELCDTKLPYICFKTKNINEDTVCGTQDREYKLEPKTGSCYKLHKELRTWGDANSVCNFEGGYLAIANSPEEYGILQNMFPLDVDLKQRTWDKKWDPLFLGFRDWTEDGNWLSVHGECLAFDWEKDEPRSSKQYCGAMIRSGKLESIYCDAKSFFVCEKDPENKK
ncbi:collectin-11-like [Anticarsia gemmatalis]|uniref:collectin-11-like n=1 Tax=Anticarsia gemmatalis TaxID=129554 RepID=UPI003F7729CF